MKLQVKPFALTCGIIWGLGLFILTWWMLLFKEPKGEKTLIGKIYRGYNISPKGSIAGMLWGLVDGFAGGAVFAWMYNLLSGEPGERSLETNQP
jgi:hypothetical protein